MSFNPLVGFTKKEQEFLKNNPKLANFAVIIYTITGLLSYIVLICHFIE